MANGFIERWKGKVFIPTGSQAQFGKGSANAGENGNISVQTSTSVEPGGTAADYVLATYSLPANSLDASGRTLAITAAGSFGAGTGNKRVKIIWNPTTATVGSTIVLGSGGTIADTGTVATASLGWQLMATVVKTGANNSNTQMAIHNQAQIGSVTAGLLVPTFPTATENAPINLAVTGNATSLTTDIVFNFLEVNAAN